MAEKKRLRLQPSLPRIRNRKEKHHPEQPKEAPEQETTPQEYEENWEGYQAPADAPRGSFSAEPEPKKHSAAKKPARFKRPLEGGLAAFKPAMQDKRLLAGMVVAIAAVIIILIVLWVYPMSQPAPGNAVTDSQVRAELARLDQINAYPWNMNINPSDYPKAFGEHKGRTLEEVYFCSDVCPDYGSVYMVYKDVDPEACSGIGRAVHDISFGGYIGCEPNVGN